MRGLAALGDAPSIALLKAIIKEERPKWPEARIARQWRPAKVCAAAGCALAGTGNVEAMDAACDEIRASSKIDPDFCRDVACEFATSAKADIYLRTVELLKGDNQEVHKEVLIGLGGTGFPPDAGG